MKNQQLQTKRQANKKGFRKIHAKVTSSRRKQRVSASANPGTLDSDVPNASISRSLTVILVLHVVAISAVYIGVQWNKDKAVIPETTAPVTSEVDLSNFNEDRATAFAVAGDTYSTFAARHSVDEAELRSVNRDAIIHAGKPVYLPNKKIVVAPVAVSDRPPLPTTNNVVQIEIPKAQVVKPSVARAVPVAAVASGQTYKVQSGDSIWRISKKHNVAQDALMTLNNLKTARDLKAGMTLTIPAK